MKAGMIGAVVGVLSLVWLGQLAQAQSIGELARLERIDFRGITAFTPEQLVRGMRNSKHIAAARFTMPTNDYLALVQKSLLSGYQFAGYVQAQVAATTTRDERGLRISVDVQEGPHFTYGDIHITGVTDEIAQHIRRRLTGATAESGQPGPASNGVNPRSFLFVEEAEVPPAPESRLWSPGRGFASSGTLSDRLQTHIRDALADEGYEAAKFQAHSKCDGTQMVLHVSVDELGPQAMIAAIDVTGNARDTDEEILQYLGVQTGQVWSEFRRRAVRHDLWASGRFLKHDVTTETTPEGIRLLIDVHDYRAAPKLTVDLTREEAAVLKMRDWLVQGAGWSKDFVFHYAYGPLDCTAIASATDGVLVEIGLGATEQARQRSKHFLVLTPSEVRIYAVERQQKFAWKITGVHFTPTVHMSILDDPVTNRTRSTKVGFGMKSQERDGEASAVRLTLGMPPVYFLAMAHEKVERCEWHDDELTIYKSDGTLRLNALTGEHLESLMRVPDSEQPLWTTSTSENAFVQRLEAVEMSSRAWPASPDPARPLSSTVEFLFSSGLADLWSSHVGKGLPKVPQMITLAGKLTRLGLFEPIESYLCAAYAAGGTGSGFRVAGADAVQAEGLKPTAAVMLWRSADNLYANGQWPWHVLREGCSQLFEADYSPDAAVDKICGDADVGPLACFLTASLLGPKTDRARQVATLGLERFDREAFLRDCTTLLDERHTGGAFARRCCEVIPQLTPSELELLETYLHTQGALARVAAALARHNGEEDMTQAAAVDLWDTWAARRMHARLRVLQGPDPLLSTPFVLPPTVR